MPDRLAAGKDFADRSGWQGAKRQIVAGDASNRKYFRLGRNGRTAILMDADPAAGEDVAPFMKITAVLRGAGLSAPEIMAADEGAGFLLLEDLGDDLYARLLRSGRYRDADLYPPAVDVLLHLRDVPPPPLERYTSGRMAAFAALAAVWYRRGVTGTPDAAVEAEFKAGLEQALAPLDAGPRAMILRDYHAENLIWLPGRAGIARVGLLDFQDAELGHPLYDLVSVLQDARRDVPAETEAPMCARYRTGAGLDRAEFDRAYALLGLQRNLRILGVFARLCMRDGKRHYVDLIPRVWGHVLTDLRRLDDPDLDTLVRGSLPEPQDANLDRIRDACQTIPAP